jgi:hypothetical protein
MGRLYSAEEQDHITGGFKARRTGERRDKVVNPSRRSLFLWGALALEEAQFCDAGHIAGIKVA